ncbi:UNVERIFIED_CONTAM: hypothetical protein NCL1_62616 [Trichonephila clavipes]
MLLHANTRSRTNDCGTTGIETSSTSLRRLYPEQPVFQLSEKYIWSNTGAYFDNKFILASYVAFFSFHLGLSNSTQVRKSSHKQNSKVNICSGVPKAFHSMNKHSTTTTERTVSSLVCECAIQ